MTDPVHHPIFARLWAHLAASLEKAGAAGHRDEALEGLSGRVIEVGAGTGINFHHYPGTVTEIVAVEPEAHLRDAAQRAAQGSPIPIGVVDGVGEHLPGYEGEFDAGVVALVLCSVADPHATLGELHRLIRPGGELRFYEHVRASDPKRARWQDRADIIWPRFAGGCHPNRPTTDTIQEAGFEIDRIRRFKFQPSPALAPISSFVIGRAVRRG
jgi:ubiquinone/menaquinone biosynthesis C-methylase UbiE